MRRLWRLLPLLAALFAPGLAQAQQYGGCPYPLSYGQVLTAAQWNACLFYGLNSLQITGGVMNGRLVTAPVGSANVPTTGAFNLPPGGTPNAPQNGDMWSTSAGVFARVNGSNVGPFGTGSGSVTTTGSPASGNLTKFSGAASITNGDLSGDVTTSGTLSTTVVNLSSVTNGSLANSGLANHSVTIAGNSVNLGSSLSATTLTASLNLATTSLQGLLPSGGTSSGQYFGGDYAFHTLSSGGCTPTGTNALQKNNSGACAAAAITDNATTLAATEPLSITGPANSVAFSASTSLTGASVNDGFDYTETWNTSGGSAIAWKLAVTNTSCSSCSLMKIFGGAAGSTLEFSLDSGGSAVFTGNVSGQQGLFSSTVQAGNNIQMPSGNGLYFGNSCSQAGIHSTASSTIVVGCGNSGGPFNETLASDDSSTTNNTAGGTFTLHPGASTGTGVGPSNQFCIQTGVTNGSSGSTKGTFRNGFCLDGETQLASLPQISSDSGHTTAAVCEDTSTHKLYAGTGIGGNCSGGTATSPLITPALIGGYYYSTPYWTGNTSNLTTSAGGMYYTPVWLQAGTVITSLGIHVSSLVAASTADLGVYKPASNGGPGGGALLSDACTVNTTANGDVVCNAISVTIPSTGWYWLFVWTSSTPSLLGVNLNVGAQAYTGIPRPGGSFTFTTTTSGFDGSATYTAGSAPSTAPTASVNASGANPAVWFCTGSCS